MTSLTKPVRRRGTVPVHVIGNQLLVVELRPGDKLVVRQERRRVGYEATFAEVFMILADLYGRRRDHFIRRRTRELTSAGTPKRSARTQATLEWKRSDQGK
jgi:hypothetical protein